MKHEKSKSPAPAPSHAPEKGLSAQSAGDRAATPLLTKESGNAVTNAVADVVDRLAAPFQNLGQPKVSAFDKAQKVVAAVAGLANAPTDFLNDAFARATNGVAKALPSFPAATMGALVVGAPHIHNHPPSYIPPGPPVPLPAVGWIMTGCPTVLINGMPAARAGDFGMAPTCGAFTPIFEVITGSSKVFIGGSRAARLADVTRQCAPSAGSAAAAKGAAAASKMATAAAVAQKVVGGAGKLATAMGVLGAGLKIYDTHKNAAAAQAAANAAQAAADASADASDGTAAAAADAAAAAASAGAEASAAVLAAAMMGADLAMGAVKTAMGSMMGKDPGTPACLGTVMLGSPVVLIGGFPMPSWAAVANGLKKLGAALVRGRRGGAARGRWFCFNCM